MSERRDTNKSRLLALMSDYRWHHMRELHDVAGWRYGGRLHELKKAGHVYEKRYLGDDEFEYRLIKPECQGVLV